MKLFKPVASTDNDLANLIFIYLGDSSNEISGDFKLFVLYVSCGPTLISTRCFVQAFHRVTYRWHRRWDFYEKFKEKYGKTYKIAKIRYYLSEYLEGDKNLYSTSISSVLLPGKQKVGVYLLKKLLLRFFVAQSVLERVKMEVDARETYFARPLHFLLIKTSISFTPSFDPRKSKA